MKDVGFILGAIIIFEMYCNVGCPTLRIYKMFQTVNFESMN